LEKILKQVVPGDTIAFDSVSRMSRNAEEGFELYEKLFYDGVELVFLKEPHINTATYKKALENNIQMTGTNVDYILEGINKYLMALAKGLPLNRQRRKSQTCINVQGKVSRRHG